APRHPLWQSEGQHGPGRPDPGFRSAPFSTASNREAAPPDARELPAMGSTTATDTPDGGRPGRSGTASRSPPHRTSGTPSATAPASRPDASRRAAATRAPAAPPTP